MERNFFSIVYGWGGCKRSKQPKPKPYPSFTNLPSNLTAHILLQLPLKSLLICKCVCKYWKTLISESHFAKLHSDRTPMSFMVRPGDTKLVSRTLHLLQCDPQHFEIGFNYRVKLDPVFKLPLRNETTRSNVPGQNYIACKPSQDKFSVVSSCNGLLCLSDPSNGMPLLICNPITGEFIKLPKPTTTPTRLNTGRVRMKAMAGFGFQLKTNEYKVIKLWVRHVRRSNNWVFERVTLEINTLGTPSWRNVEVDPRVSILRLKDPTCLNDALHWIRIGDDLQMSLLCFNFESEILQSFPSPPLVFDNGIAIDTYAKQQIKLGELRGFLYICDASFLHDVSMWIMNKYGIGESWTKVYNINTFSRQPCPRYGFCWPIQHFEEGHAIMLYLYSYNCFIYYEPEKYGFKVFRIHGIQSRGLCEVIPHIPSLISLKDVVKGDNTEVLNIHSRCARFKLQEEDEVLSLAPEFVSDLASTPSDFLDQLMVN